MVENAIFPHFQICTSYLKRVIFFSENYFCGTWDLKSLLKRERRTFQTFNRKWRMLQTFKLMTFKKNVLTFIELIYFKTIALNDGLILEACSNSGDENDVVLKRIEVFSCIKMNYFIIIVRFQFKVIFYCLISHTNPNTESQFLQECLEGVSRSRGRSDRKILKAIFVKINRATADLQGMECICAIHIEKRKIDEIEITFV